MTKPDAHRDKLKALQRQLSRYKALLRKALGKYNRLKALESRIADAEKLSNDDRHMARIGAALVAAFAKAGCTLEIWRWPEDSSEGGGKGELVQVRLSGQRKPYTGASLLDALSRVNEEKKWCSQCNDYRPVAAFKTNNSRPGGRESVCRKHKPKG